LIQIIKSNQKYVIATNLIVISTDTMGGTTLAGKGKPRRDRKSPLSNNSNNNSNYTLIVITSM